MIRRLCVVLSAALFLVSCSSEDGTPTMSFDGEAATYSGPSVLTEMPMTFVLENPTTKMVTFGWHLVADESVTFDEEVAWMDTHQGDNYGIPQWVEEYGGIADVNFMNDTREESAELPDGTILLWVWDPSGKVMFPAARVTVDTN